MPGLHEIQEPKPAHFESILQHALFQSNADFAVSLSCIVVLCAQYSFTIIRRDVLPDLLRTAHSAYAA